MQSTRLNPSESQNQQCNIYKIIWHTSIEQCMLWKQMLSLLPGTPTEPVSPESPFIPSIPLKPALPLSPVCPMKPFSPVRRVSIISHQPTVSLYLFWFDCVEGIHHQQRRSEHYGLYTLHSWKTGLPSQSCGSRNVNTKAFLTCNSMLHLLTIEILCIQYSFFLIKSLYLSKV